MCTCISTRRFFGRTLDVEASYGEKVVVTPRNFPLPFRQKENLSAHCAIMGMAHVVDNYPLYYDAMNEHGLCMAGLHFPKSCRYFSLKPGKDNLTSFEVPLWILGTCTSVMEARPLLCRMNILDTAFSPELPTSPLHWLLADGQHSVVIESGENGLQIYDDPEGALTNEPPFPKQMALLRRYSPKNRGKGLPGDWTSPARFQRAVYAKENLPKETVGDFFRTMDTIFVPKGSVKVQGRDHYTAYTSCCDRKTHTYHYTTYDHRAPVAVDITSFKLDAKTLLFPGKEVSP